MKVKWKILILCLIIVYLAASVGSIFTGGSIGNGWYDSIKPSITPPNFVFPIVWNILFFLIALSLYFSWISAKSKNTKKSIAIVFGLNLFFNAFWSFVFFEMQNPVAAFYEIIVLLISIVSMLILTWRINKKSFYLLIPYFLWVCFAWFLNWMIAFS